MARKDSEHQKKSMSLMFRGKEIFKLLNTGRIDDRVACVREWITERKERLRSTHYEEVSQTFKDASQAGVEFWEIQMDFKPEGVTLYSVTKSTDL